MFSDQENVYFPGVVRKDAQTMKWNLRRQQPSTVPPSTAEPATAQSTDLPKPSRRGLLGMLKTAGIAITAAAGVQALAQTSTPTAHADTIGNFSSSTSTNAVTAI